MTEEELKKLKEQGIKFPVVDENCIGCGACVAICEDAFDIDEEGKAFVIEGKNSSNSECIDDAISACPVDAIDYL